MAITVKSAKELVNETGALNMVVYGPPGIGKTTFASTAPKPLIIDLEGGFLSIAGKDVDVCRAHTLKDVREAIRHAIDNKYGTVVIDSLTRLAEMHMKEIVGGDGRPQIHHWGMLVDRIKQLAWGLQGEQIHVVFICLEREDKDEDSVLKRPDLPGQLRTALPAIVDEVAYMTVQDGQRVLAMSPNPRWYAKDRSGQLDPFETPDFVSLWEKIKAGVNTGEAPKPTTKATSNTAGGVEMMTDKQRKKIFALAGEHDIDKENLKTFACMTVGVESFKDIPSSRASKLIEALEQDAKAIKEKIKELTS